jgi:hypothetical protein
MYAIDTNEWRLDDILSEYRERAPKLHDDDCMNHGVRSNETEL